MLSAEFTFEIAKYLMFSFFLRIMTMSSKEYLLFGGFVLPTGKSRNISELLFFCKTISNYSILFTHARFILNMLFSGIGIP